MLVPRTIRSSESTPDAAEGTVSASAAGVPELPSTSHARLTAFVDAVSIDETIQ